MTEEKVVTRFAPSPTGFMHVGGVRTALFAYLHAKKSNGTFILRIEDTDKEREVAGAIEQIKKSLRYILQDPKKPKIFPNTEDLASDALSPWDDFYIQSSRLDLYKYCVKKMVESGYAYFDPYTKEEVDILRQKAQDEKRPFLFREHRPEITDTDWNENIISKNDTFIFKKPIRFKISEISKTSWMDAVRGELSAGVEALDDFIIMKTDGYPTYNLCHIIDDIDMEVTHVMRGEEFIPSTPKFIALYKALEISLKEDVRFKNKSFKLPIFVTLPPILGETGTKKLSKRDGAKDVLDYHKEGFLPEALANFLAFQGWNPGGEKELYSMDELVESFSIERIQKSGARWNPLKLDWFNKEYLKNTNESQQISRSVEEYKNSLKYQFLLYLSSDLQKKYLSGDLTSQSNIAKLPVWSDSFNSLFSRYLERISYFGQLKEEPLLSELSFVINKPIIDLNLIYDTLDKENTKLIIVKLIDVINNYTGDWTEDSLRHVLSDLVKEQGTKNVLWPLRTALSGQRKSLDPFSILSILGKEESLKRIVSVLEEVNK